MMGRSLCRVRTLHFLIALLALASSLATLDLRARRHLQQARVHEVAAERIRGEAAKLICVRAALRTVSHRTLIERAWQHEELASRHREAAFRPWYPVASFGLDRSECDGIVRTRP